MLGSKGQRFAAGYGCPLSGWSMGRAVQVQREEGKCLALSACSSQSGGMVVQAQGQGKEGGSPCARVSYSTSTTVLCGTAVSVPGQLRAGREGKRLEPGGLSAGWRPAEHLLERRRCLYLLVMESSAICLALKGAVFRAYSSHRLAFYSLGASQGWRLL